MNANTWFPRGLGRGMVAATRSMTHGRTGAQHRVIRSGSGRSARRIERCAASFWRCAEVRWRRAEPPSRRNQAHQPSGLSQSGSPRTPLGVIALPLPAGVAEGVLSFLQRPLQLPLPVRLRTYSRFSGV
jgi:hypothetical protein